jgi:CRISPR/Cas system-associated endoribonuclease Cas2
VEGKMTKIDYTKLNERIVEQAYESVFGAEMTKEQFQKLIQDKFERARHYSESLNKSPTFSVN